MINKLATRDLVKLRKPDPKATNKRMPGDFLLGVRSAEEGSFLIETNGIALISARAGIFNVPSAHRGARDLWQPYCTRAEPSADFVSNVRKMWNDAENALFSADRSHPKPLLRLDPSGVMLGNPTDPYHAAVFTAHPYGGAETVGALALDCEHANAIIRAGLSLVTTLERLEKKAPPFIVSIETMHLQNPYRVEQYHDLYGILQPFATMPIDKMRERLDSLSSALFFREAQSMKGASV